MPPVGNVPEPGGAAQGVAPWATAARCHAAGKARPPATKGSRVGLTTGTGKDSQVNRRGAQATHRKGILAWVSSLPKPDPSPEPASNAELVGSCKRGDPRAWEQLVQRFERLIFTIARRAGLSQDEAGDVFQTVFERLHRHLGRLTEPERVQAWLVTTAKRETLRLLREGRRTQPMSALGSQDDDTEPSFEAGIEDSGPLPQDLLEQLQLQHLARLALARLPEPCQTLLTLLYCGEEPTPYTEISRRLRMPAGSIGPTKARCLAKLRSQMIEKG